MRQNANPDRESDYALPVNSLGITLSGLIEINTKIYTERMTYSKYQHSSHLTERSLCSTRLFLSHLTIDTGSSSSAFFFVIFETHCSYVTMAGQSLTHSYRR